MRKAGAVGLLVTGNLMFKTVDVDLRQGLSRCCDQNRRPGIPGTFSM